MSNLTVIHQQEVLGQGFKVYGTTEEPLFLAKDVATWIEHSNLTMMMKVVDREEKIIIKVPTKKSLGGLQGNTEYTFLTEEGIYEILMLSRKPIAKQWKKEVKKILKNIRLNGGHVRVDREEEFIHSHFPSFSEEVKKAMVLDLREQNKQLQQTIQVQAPKVEKYDSYLDRDGGVLSYVPLTFTPSAISSISIPSSRPSSRYLN
ncbi:BRO family protein [Bacillus mycoides]|uniref:BRO-N domain-containing protein n=1 Tax=Bacillus mycoides TaxID=1405 RepID=UPI003D1D6012